MAQFCLPKQYVDKLLQALTSLEITPESFMYESDGVTPLTSEARREMIAKYVGAENAAQVNAEIEVKLLQKNWQKGVITAIKSLTGMKPEIKNDLVSKVERMEKYLTPTEQGNFYEDIASKKLGVAVTPEEIKTITDYTKKIADLRKTYENTGTYDDRINLGLVMNELTDYIVDINPSMEGIPSQVINLPRALMSTADLSALFRQGWGVMTSKEFWNAVPKMFLYAKSAFGGKNYYKQLQAEVVTNPFYNKALKDKLRISALAKSLSQREENYISNLQSKIPVLGNVFQASEQAYTGFLTKVRMDMYANLMLAAEASGENISSKSNVGKDIASVVNTLTGSGNVGKNDQYAQAVPLFNAIFFSPRKISSLLNMFNPATYLDPRTSKTARKAAIRQMAGSIAAITILLTAFRLALGDDAVELDPRSSDFGKLRVGNTRYDISGGNAGFLVLLSRLITQRTKSSSDDTIKKLGDGFGSTTGDQLALRFFTNKFSPAASFVMTMFAQKDFEGNDVKVGKEILGRLYPLVAQEIVELAKEDPGQLLFAVPASIFGIGASTYGANNRNTIIRETYEKYGTGSRDRALNDIYRRLEEAEDTKLTSTQKNNLKKDYAVYTAFGNDKKLLNTAVQFASIGSNEDKLEFLKKLKEKDRTMYNQLIKKGRNTIKTKSGNDSPILISDSLYDML